MLIRNRLEELAMLGEPLHLALGVFDGVHLGHREVIARAVRAAEKHGGLAGLLTFHPHPCQAVRPDKAPPSLLATLDHKARIVEGLGIRLFVPLHFDAEFAAVEAKDFLEALTAAPVRTIAVGEDWRFGRCRVGDVAMLESEATGRGFHLETVAAVMFQGERISSTRIRQAIREGHLDFASQMLGRPYSICGEVVSGDQLGRTIGFPTANVFTGDAQLPPDGVWAVRATLVEDGSIRDGIANLGSRPTVGGGPQRLEVHLFGFSGDLYGKNLDVQFVKHLRGEERFPSLDVLRQQIETDVGVARQVLSGDFGH
ncbi:MAG: bifunctional riboflavin kinase/FAD synthetase [Verrucomicrobiota bacterium]